MPGYGNGSRSTPGSQTRAPAKVGLLAGCVGAGCAAILSVMIPQFESGGRQYLHAYRDQLGIWTICDGDTQNVGPNTVETPEGCAVRNEKRIVEHAAPLLRCAPELRGRDNQLAALVSLTYNAGVAGVCGSSIVRNIKAGAWRPAADGILAWDKGTYTQPRVPPKGYRCVARPPLKGKKRWLCVIPGLTKRRQQERARFLMGLPA